MRRPNFAPFQRRSAHSPYHYCASNISYMAQPHSRSTVTLDSTFTLGDTVEEQTRDRHFYARRFWTHLVDSSTPSSGTPLIVCEPFGQYILEQHVPFALRGNLILLPYPRQPILHVNPTQYVETSAASETNMANINTMSVSSFGRVMTCNLSDDEFYWDVVMEHRDYEFNERTHYSFTIRYIVSHWIMTTSPDDTFVDGSILSILGSISSYGLDAASWTIRALRVRPAPAEALHH
ncbi:uncharacterized protein MELLADRAFT_88324 [Melampsora larici-populina 98AG31]|uniref:Uncharacterized protein n=1 Tax=Melampsora larici-populina (strain 98AG31 / pathotype 3-4-7) TaxID=747676 RepID=F4RRB7_MELLP|nr:uncharacterized protein MELLADRAFT_88324 [Melampsora larici-populina 98AG31]EGG04911.1 hypothetical protein MELLADRAFT_88324 [Melampsora larici-populina 98AG31]